MEDRSDKPSRGNGGFIGLRCDPDLKAEAEEQAEAQGISLSELIRRRLKNRDEAAGQRAATT